MYKLPKPKNNYLCSYKYFGMANVGNSCFLNSCLQSLLSLESFYSLTNEYFVEITRQVKNGSTANKYLEPLNHIIRMIINGEAETGIMKNFYQSSIESIFELPPNEFRQQDANEYLIHLKSYLDCAFDILQGTREDQETIPKLELFSKLFMVYLQNKRELSCGHQRNGQIEIESDLILPVKRVRNSSIQKLIDDYIQEIRPLDDFTCEICKIKKTGTVKHIYISSSNVLSICLGRFRDNWINGVNSPIKIRTEVGVNSIIKFCNSHYKLRAILCHKGPSSHSGHYIAVAKRKDKWCIFDDDQKVKQINGFIKDGFAILFNKDFDPYILLYEKTNENNKDIAISRSSSFANSPVGYTIHRIPKIIDYGLLSIDHYKTFHKLMLSIDFRNFKIINKKFEILEHFQLFADKKITDAESRYFWNSDINLIIAHDSPTILMIDFFKMISDVDAVSIDLVKFIDPSALMINEDKLYRRILDFQVGYKLYQCCSSGSHSEYDSFSTEENSCINIDLSEIFEATSIFEYLKKLYGDHKCIEKCSNMCSLSKNYKTITEITYLPYILTFAISNNHYNIYLEKIFEELSLPNVSEDILNDSYMLFFIIIKLNDETIYSFAKTSINRGEWEYDDGYGKISYINSIELNELLADKGKPTLLFYKKIESNNKLNDRKETEKTLVDLTQSVHDLTLSQYASARECKYLGIH